MAKHLTLLLFLSAASFARALPEDKLSDRVATAVQPVLDAMTAKYNTSFQFGFVDSSGSVGLASGMDNIWEAKLMTPDTPVPLGSVTKPWTAVRILQEVEKGTIGLEDAAKRFVDPVLTRLYNHSMETLYGPNASLVRIVDLLQHTTGFGDYDDQVMKEWSIANDADDVDPFFYLLSASAQPVVCAVRECSSYSGANYVLLGFVMVQVLDLYSWQEFDQLTTIPQRLRDAGHFRHTTFPKLGRCLQYPGVAHSYATIPKGNSTIVTDLGFNSCLNGWTMGNVASTGRDLAHFFYDLVTLAPSNEGFVNATTLAAMMNYKPMVNRWCTGPKGPGSCQYGLGLEHAQLGLDYWDPFIQKPLPKMSKPEDLSLIGHDGADWGSTAAPCGYNPKWGFGICVVHASSSGLNCSMTQTENGISSFETLCRVYDAVLGEVDGPRLKCDIALPPQPDSPKGCVWRKVSGDIPPKRRGSISKVMLEVLAAQNAQVIV
jgi:CubicO group peptidase (beta-lactamase class C family)